LQLGLALDPSLCESLEPLAGADIAQTKPTDSELTETKNRVLECDFWIPSLKAKCQLKTWPGYKD